jgi:hypothetical protein
MTDLAKREVSLGQGNWGLQVAPDVGLEWMVG